MSHQEAIRRSVERGKVAAQRGAVVARHVAGKVSAAAVRQSQIALPILKKVSRKVALEIQRQAIAAQPVIHQAAQSFFTFVHSQSKHTGRMIKACAQHFRKQTAPRIREWSQQHPRVVQMSLMCAACLFGMIALVSSGSRWFSSPGEFPLATMHGTGALTPAAETSPKENVPNENALFTEIETPEPSITGAESQQAFEMQQRLQQAQSELEQAAINYDYAMGQWNAEVAACQQSGPPAGYTAHQRGNFAAMGISVETQQRQPNQVLQYAAQQAAQRYFQARDNCERLANGQ